MSLKKCWPKYIRDKPTIVKYIKHKIKVKMLCHLHQFLFKKIYKTNTQIVVAMQICKLGKLLPKLPILLSISSEISYGLGLFITNFKSSIIAMLNAPQNKKKMPNFFLFKSKKMVNKTIKKYTLAEKLNE